MAELIFTLDVQEMQVETGVAKAEFDLTAVEPVSFKAAVGICREELQYKHRFKVRRVLSI